MSCDGCQQKFLPWGRVCSEFSLAWHSGPSFSSDRFRLSVSFVFRWVMTVTTYQSTYGSSSELTTEQLTGLPMAFFCLQEFGILVMNYRSWNMRLCTQISALRFPWMQINCATEVESKVGFLPNAPIRIDLYPSVGIRMETVVFECFWEVFTSKIRGLDHWATARYVDAVRSSVGPPGTMATRVDWRADDHRTAFLSRSWRGKPHEASMSMYPAVSPWQPHVTWTWYDLVDLDLAAGVNIWHTLHQLRILPTLRCGHSTT